MRRAQACNRSAPALKLVLVNPPFRYHPGVKGSSFNYTRPPLGIAYLAAYLRENFPTPLGIRLFDCEAEKIRTSQGAVRAITEFDPDVVGLSTVTGTYHAVSEIAQGIKRAMPNVVTIAGGPHITALPKEPTSGIDVKIVGEGELSLLQYLKARFLDGESSEIDGCIVFEDGKIVSCRPARNLIEPLDTIPIPARDLFRRRAYYHSYPYKGGRNFTTMFTSRGCPFNCTFCCNELLWGRMVRYHSLEKVYQEIDSLVKDGYNLVFIDDDTFTSNTKRVASICEYIKHNHPAFRWICHIRADTADREILTLMKAAGCVEVQVGIESGDEQILKNINKGMDLGSARKIFPILHSLKINSWTTFIIGNSGETPKTVRETIEFAKELDSTYCSFIVLLPLPGTHAFEEFRKNGWITTYDWRCYSWHGYPVIDLPELSSDELVKWRKRAYKEFYLRPKKLVQSAVNMLKALSWREMVRNLFAWWVLIFPKGKRNQCAGRAKTEPCER